RGVGIDRRVKIVAERGTERGLETLLDRDEIERRRPHLLSLDAKHPRERLGLGVEALEAPLRLFERAARRIEALACRRMAGFRAHRRRFRFGDRTLRRLDRARERGEVFAPGRPIEARQLALNFADLALEAHEPLGMLAHRALELVAPSREIGKRA